MNLSQLQLKYAHMGKYQVRIIDNRSIYPDFKENNIHNA